MNPEYETNTFNNIKGKSLAKVIGTSADPLLLDFLSKILEYSPLRRLNAIEALSHQYFDELRDFKTL